MADECCIASCNSTKAKGDILHWFPNPAKFRKRFHIWVRNAGLVGDYNYIYTHKQICYKHFEDKYVSMVDRLNRYAIPTLFIPGPIELLETGPVLQEAQTITADEFKSIDKDVSMSDHDLEKELIFPGTSTDPMEITEPAGVETEAVVEKHEITNTNTESVGKPVKTKAPRSEDKKERYKCTECDRYTTIDPDRLVRHIRKVHRGENPFQCGMCEYGTYNKAVFEDHVRWHQGVKPFQCKTCNYKSVSKNNLSKHEKKHKPQECKTCGKLIYTRKGFEWHMKSAHPETSWVFCKHCKADFKTKKKLRYHQKTYVKSCDKCDAKVCSKAMMIKHMADVHNDYFYKSDAGRNKKKGVYAWTCQVCKWEAKNEQKTLLHLIHHPNQEIDRDAIDVTPLLKWNILPLAAR